MKQITISEAQKSTSPNPISLICVNTPEGNTNLTAISWWTYLANHPPMVGFAISKKSYTGELLVQNGHSILSIPGSSIAKETFQCGCSSGRNTNKAPTRDAGNHPPSSVPSMIPIGWYDQLGGDDSPLSEVILDRIKHDAYKINIVPTDPANYRSMREVYGFYPPSKNIISFIEKKSVTPFNRALTDTT